MTASPVKETPYCSLCLVISALICHSMVLTGNLLTASSMNTIGQSSSGWSSVGIGLARALADELDEQMIIVTEALTEALNQTADTQEYLDVVMSMAAKGAEAAGKSQGNASSALEIYHPSIPPAAVSFLQEQAATHGPLDRLPGLLIEFIDPLATMLLGKASEMLEKLLEKIKPALLKIGEWVLKFGDKIQAIVEAFSTTLDMVQKLFDQMMSQMHGPGEGEDLMIHDTYTLFDPSNNGSVTAKSLRTAAQLYALTPLAGNKSEELMAKYDQDENGKLDMEEFELFVQDESIPNLMASVLRTYTKKLSEVAGNVGKAKMRDEVAQTVVRYFGLVCAKNMTKVGWVSDRLTNGSLPLEFTADVMAEMCLANDDPNKLTTAEVGGIVIKKMMELNHTGTLAAFDLMSGADFWVSEGLPSDDQPRCVEMVTRWVMAAQSGENLLDDQLSPTDRLTDETLEAMPMMARRLAHERMSQYERIEEQSRMERRKALYSTSASQTMLFTLLGGQSASDGVDPKAIREAVNSGVPARPETLEFAKFLSWNASSTAERFMHQCMEYTSQSSSPMDAFATVVQGMIKKFIGFLNMMEKYSTPDGIDQLTEKIHDFAEHAMADLKIVIVDKLGDLINKSAPAVIDAVDGAIHSVGNSVSHTLGDFLGTPIGKALQKPLGSIIGAAINDTEEGATVGEDVAHILGSQLVNITEAAVGRKIGDVLENVIGEALEYVTPDSVMNASATEPIGDSTSDANSSSSDSSSSSDTSPTDGINSSSTSDDLPVSSTPDNLPGSSTTVTVAPSTSEIDMNISSTTDSISSSYGLVSRPLHKAIHHPDRGVGHVESLRSQLGKEMLASGLIVRQKTRMDMQGPDLSGVWTSVTSMLRSVGKILPVSTGILKFVRLEVSKLSHQLADMFTPFKQKGPEIFGKISWYWKALWISYYILMVVLLAFLLYYAFWASGFCGGPKPVSDITIPVPAGPVTWRDRFATCWASCCICMTEFHDWHLCLWSCIIVMQVFVLVLFVVSLVLCILAGVKAFVNSGCESVYILTDEMVCDATMATIKAWLDSFYVTDVLLPLEEACERELLLTCQLISDRMQLSMMFTTVFSFLAVVFTMQIVIDTAVLHERARWHRILATIEKEEKGE